MRQRFLNTTLIAVVTLVWTLSSCTPSMQSNRSENASNRPTDIDETIPGYLDSSSRTLEKGEGGELTVGVQVRVKFHSGVRTT